MLVLGKSLQCWKNTQSYFYLVNQGLITLYTLILAVILVFGPFFFNFDPHSDNITKVVESPKITSI